MAPQMRKTALAHVENYFLARNAANLRPLRQAQSILVQLVDHDKDAAKTKGLSESDAAVQERLDTLATAAEVSFLVGASEAAERLFGDLFSSDACTHQRKLPSQPSCIAFAGGRLAILRRQARDPAGARKAVTAAVDRGATWDAEWQIPPDHLAGLSSRPVWGISDVPLASLLAASFRDIVADLHRLQKAAAASGKRSHAAQWRATPDFFLLLPGGRWDEILLKGVSWNEKVCAIARNTCRLLAHLTEVNGRGHLRGVDLGVPGRVAFLRMGPGTELRPHTSNWNGRLNVHLPLTDSGGCADHSPPGGVRVADEIPLRWAAGEPIVFDDSFVHEASLPMCAKEDRILLHVSVWHPQIVVHTAGQESEEEL